MADGTRLAVDFSTVYVTEVDPADAELLYAQGARLAVIGFDTTPESAAVQSVMTGAGFDFHPYRFMYSERDPVEQVDNVVEAFRALSGPPPEILHLDIEPTWNADGSIKAPPPSIEQLRAAMDRVEALGIRDGAETEPSMYTAKYVWDRWYAGWTEPMDRGWRVWPAEWDHLLSVIVNNLFGGWTQDRVIGRQVTPSVATPIGVVDLSQFLPARGAPAPAPQPVQPDSALVHVKAARGILAPALAIVPDAAAADAELDEAEQDLTPAEVPA